MGFGFLRVLRGLSSQFPNKNRNGLRMPELVIDHRRIHRPIHSGNRPCRQLIIKSGSFADQRKAVAFLDQHLHLGRMRGTLILRDFDACIGKQLKKPLMRVGMALRVIQNREIVLQISSLQCGFTCQTVIPAEHTTSRSRRISSMRSSVCFNGNVTMAASTAPARTSSAS